MEIDNAILNLLKTGKKELTTYEIAKTLKIAWSTTNTHCGELRHKGLLQSRDVKPHIGDGKKRLWSIKKD